MIASNTFPFSKVSFIYFPFVDKMEIMLGKMLISSRRHGKKLRNENSITNWMETFVETYTRVDV